jgi:bifunctional DNA-binding transcriptional regulator/antitoxin component of YhaV-PrlF toxin-antitoxin module
MRNVGHSRLTGKFQATIPKVVRGFMRLDKGDLLVFVIHRNEVLLKKGEIKIKH